MRIGSSQIGSSHIRSLGRAAATETTARTVGSASDERGDEAGPKPGHAGKAATSVSLSPEAQEALRDAEEREDSHDEDGNEVLGDTTARAAADKKKTGELSEKEKREVAELKARDAEVRAHEAAHVGAAGGHTNGGIKYEFQRGPDNQQYAVGGHVNIDTSPVAGDPQRTIQKADTVRRAALAPSDPSGADKQVAAKAMRTASKARTELAQEKAEDREDADSGGEESDHETRDEGNGPRPTVRASQAIASYAMAA